MTTSPIPGARRTDPLVPVGHPNFAWTTEANVQATWRKYGWLPQHEAKSQEQEKKFIL